MGCALRAAVTVAWYTSCASTWHANRITSSSSRASVSASAKPWGHVKN
eukprot:CAMPEP_0202363090 /NCGR_PEP_ID=MMETSP1126-20121109/15024_1 /ASSEMBLY_ACC=CAM_ASM_000457 /TAXON_ID=3047 /ORGANISM="Dunaliella tertiolecta, Strain CCMP1320" /LENGTH=47 /DNA_ID= /DNA_START= /DNA_END= /DNA_ORIENTATION=